MSINYPKEKFEQATYGFLVLYQKDELNMDIGQVIERTIYDTILYCQNDTLKKYVQRFYWYVMNKPGMYWICVIFSNCVNVWKLSRITHCLMKGIGRNFKQI